MIKVIIAGSRTFNDYKLLAITCDFMLQNQTQVEIVSGGAKGADKLGELYAEENMYDMKRFEPDWSSNGVAAGYMRNKEMAFYADALIVFWDGYSKGSKHMIDIAKSAGLKVKVCEYKRNDKKGVSRDHIRGI